MNMVIGKVIPPKMPYFTPAHEGAIQRLLTTFPPYDNHDREKMDLPTPTYPRASVRTLRPFQDTFDRDPAAVAAQDQEP